MNILDTMLKNAKKKVAKVAQFYCEKCDYNTSKKFDYEKHLLTKKHQHNVNAIGMLKKVAQKSQFCWHCDCGKIYKHQSSFSRHNLKCVQSILNQKKSLDNEEILKIIKQNEEFKSLLIEQQKENNEIKQIILDQNNTITKLKNSNNITNINTNYNTNNFNLNFFLNEQCKDAINMNEFINSLKLHLYDLEETGRLGYSEGISKIFIKGLKELDVYKRPIHCSDLKREVIYIKDQDKWEKDNNEKEKIQMAIKEIGNKNIKQITLWEKENPECLDVTSKKNDQYFQIISNSMSGSTIEEQISNINKIISNVAKEVTINKS
jgi:hypothetical protein